MSKEEKSFGFMSSEDLKKKEERENLKKEEDIMRQRIRSGEMAKEMIEGEKGYTQEEWISITWHYLQDLLGRETNWDELETELKEQLEKMREKER